jgi:hypothetical protein
MRITANRVTKRGYFKREAGREIPRQERVIAACAILFSALAGIMA